MTDMLPFLRHMRDKLTKVIQDEESKCREATLVSNVERFGIKPEQVEMESEEQWFSTVHLYEEWCDKNSGKPYRVWNKGVYATGTSFKEVLCELSHLGVK